MKLIHLSDLHLGKRVNEISMIDDQQYIIREILKGIDEEQPDGVILAGDIYDKQIPPIEAVGLLDYFLTELAGRKLPVYLISGNHDSADRLHFAARLLEKQAVYVEALFTGQIREVVAEDAFGSVHIWMLPFIKPIHVKRFDPEFAGSTYQEAMEWVLQKTPIDRTERNLLICHQLVLGSVRSDSEETSIGGLDQISVDTFDAFDYVALGHIHGPQQMGRETVRYCGTPLMYSFSETEHTKSMTVVELHEKGNVEVRQIPLIPEHKMRKIRGTYDEITAKAFYQGTDTQDYLQVTLLDEEDIPEAIGRLRVIYPNIMQLTYDNKRTQENQELDAGTLAQKRDRMDFLEELYEKQNNQPMSEVQREYARKLMDKIWEGDE